MTTLIPISADLLADIADELEITIRGCGIILHEHPDHVMSRARKLRCEQFLAEIRAILPTEEISPAPEVKPSVAVVAPPIKSFGPISPLRAKYVKRPVS